MAVCAAFPEADESLAAAPAIVIPVQVNGKTRFQVEVPAGAGEDEIEAIVTAHPRYAQFTADTPVARLIIVPGRIANIVTR
jgi:leucyl-tRNA synthetase